MIRQQVRIVIGVLGMANQDSAQDDISITLTGNTA
jgi:hypothetical protein